MRIATEFSFVRRHATVHIFSFAGDVIDSLSRKSHSVVEAEELGLVRAQVTESREEKPEVDKTFNIRGVVDTRTGRVLGPDEAERRGVIDMSGEEFHDTLSGERTSLLDALKRGLIITDGGVDIATHTSQTTRTRHEKTELNIVAVVDADSRERLAPADAIARGLLDLTRHVYVNRVTGDTMSITDARDAGFIIVADDVTAVEDEDDVSIRSARDTRRSEWVTVPVAMERGILDAERKWFTSLVSGEAMTVTRAIERGFIKLVTSEVDAEEEVPTSTSATTAAAQSFSIKSVMDTRSGEEIPLEDAVRHQIVDRADQTFVDLATDTRMPIAEALRRGYVITEPIEVAGRTEAFLEFEGRPRSTLFKLLQVQDPTTGVWYDPVEAERRGLVIKLQGLFIQPITGKKLPLAQAIARGLVRAVEMDVADYDDLPEDEPIYAALEAVQAQSPLHIDVVMDTRTREEISVVEAYRRKIIDPVTNRYVDLVTGNTHTLEEALDLGLVRAHMRRTDSSYIRYNPVKTLIVIGVVDPRSDAELSVEEAIAQNLLDVDRAQYRDPSTGKHMSLSEASASGYLVIDRRSELTFDPDDEIEFVIATPQMRDVTVHAHDVTRESARSSSREVTPLTIKREGTTEVVVKKKENVQKFSFGIPSSAPEVNGVTSSSEEEEEEEEVAVSSEQQTFEKTTVTELKAERPDGPPITIRTTRVTRPSGEETVVGVEMEGFRVRPGYSVTSDGAVRHDKTGAKFELGEAIEKSIITPEEAKPMMTSTTTQHVTQRVLEEVTQERSKFFAGVSGRDVTVKRVSEHATPVQSSVASLTKRDVIAVEPATDADFDPVSSPSSSSSRHSRSLLQQVPASTLTSSLPRSSSSMSFPLGSPLRSPLALHVVGSGSSLQCGGRANNTASSAVGSLSSHALTPLEFQAPTGSTQVRVEVVRSPQASHTSQPPAGVDVTQHDAATRLAAAVASGFELPFDFDLEAVKICDPRDGRLLSVRDAVDAGLVDMATGDFCHPTTGQTINYSEAVQRGTNSDKKTQ